MSEAYSAACRTLPRRDSRSKLTDPSTQLPSSRSVDQISRLVAPPTPYTVLEPTSVTPISQPSFGFGFASAPSNLSAVPPPAAVLSFDVKAETRWGDTVVLVGSHEMFGNWRPDRGQRMATGESTYPVWRLRDLKIPPGGGALELKAVILRADESVEWEPLACNRVVDLRSSGEARVSFEWGDSAVHWRERASKTPSESGSAASSQMIPPTMSTKEAFAAWAPAPAPPAAMAVSACCSSAPPPPAAGAACEPPSQRGSLCVAPPPTSSFSIPGAASAASQKEAARKAQLFQQLMARPPLSPQPPQPPPTPPAPVVRVGDPLECIQSMDASWPPSLSPSLESLHSTGRCGSSQDLVSSKA